jgi:hypothetical protein
MNASFYGLFRRGKYGSVRPGFGSKGQRIPHEERERFVAAALGFTLCHSKRFRCWFLEKILHVPPRWANSKVEITMDENQWSDLRISGEGAGAFLCAIETKTGAPLAEHQDPRCEVFWKSGYGRELKGQKEQAELVKYCVLDIPHRKPPRARHGIECLFKTWHDMAESAPQSDSIVPDFIDLLRYTGIRLSRANKAITMKTSSLPIRNICLLQDELAAVASDYDFKVRNEEKVGEFENAYVGTQFALKKGARLFGKKAGKLKGWFGWHIIEGKLVCALFFYEAPDTPLGARVLKHFDGAKLSPKTDKWAVWVQRTPCTLSTDVKWLKSIFDGLGLPE